MNRPSLWRCPSCGFEIIIDYYSLPSLQNRVKCNKCNNECDMEKKADKGKTLELDEMSKELFRSNSDPILLVESYEFEVEAEKDEPVRYELEVELVDPEGSYKGILTDRDIIKNLEASLLDALGD